MIQYVILIAVLVVLGVIVRYIRPRRARRSRAEHLARVRPQLKQFADLTAADFARYGVWVHCHVIDYHEPWYPDTDEESFRPWTGDIPIDPEQTIFLVRTSFTLADGTVCSGFITPRGSRKQDSVEALSRMQPVLFHSSGKTVAFWFGGMPARNDQLIQIYSLFGKTPEEIFPITFEAEPGLAKGVTSGSISGFCCRQGKDRIIVKS